MKVRANGNRDEEPKTLLSRFGFQDGDLKTPKHDEMMLWLDEHADRLAAELVPASDERAALSAEMLEEVRKRWKTADEERTFTANDLAYARKKAAEAASAPPSGFRWDSPEELAKRVTEGEARLAVKKRTADVLAAVYHAIKNGTFDAPPPLGVSTVTKKTWEVPVMSGNYTVGFVDMTVSVRRPRLGWRWEERAEKPSWSVVTTDERLAFEVKSSIPSLGELIRQVRMYEPHLTADFYVVCPDDRFAEPLKGQRIGFVKYAPMDRAPDWVEEDLAEEAGRESR